MSMRLKDAENFKAILAEKGLSQNAIARSAGRSKGFISLLIDGKRGCTAETAQLILNALEPTDLTVKSLFITRIHPGEAPARGPRSSSSLPAAS